MKVLIFQPILSHYRESLFNLMVNDSDIDFMIVGGSNLNKVKEIENTSEKLNPILNNVSFTFIGHTFYFQKGWFKQIRRYKPTDVILSGPDFHFISTIFCAFYLLFFTKINVHFWTHGLSRNNSRILLKINKYLFLKARSIFTYGQVGKDSIVSKLGIKKEKVFVVQNCINEVDYGFNKSLNSKHDTSKLRILFSGRLNYNKRVDLLINAISILEQKGIPVEAIIIGDGTTKNELENLMSSKNLHTIVSFKGALYDDDVVPFFQLSNVFVLPGKVGLSIIHALSYGLPIITTSLPVHSPEYEILENNVNSFLFNDYDYHDLADKLEQYYHEIDDNKMKFSERCVKSVIDKGYIPKEVYNNFVKGIVRK